MDSQLEKSMKTSDITAGSVLVVWLSLFIAGCIGWGLNIYKIIGMSLDPLTALAVLRFIGIFIPPLGGILGYLG